MPIYILDSTVFLEGALDSLPEGAKVTVYEVAEELKSGRAIIELDKMIKSGLELLEPEEKFVLEAKKISGKTQDRVSKTDLKVIALALQFQSREKDALVVSDDYAVQNICKRENIKFLPLTKRGIKRELEWVGRCKACGAPMAGDECAVCGHKEKRFVPKQPKGKA